MTTDIRLIECKLKTPYTIEFLAFVPRFDVNKKYLISYCGTEFNTDIGINDEQYAKLLFLLQKDFGYGPFLKEPKIDLKNSILYSI